MADKIVMEEVLKHLEDGFWISKGDWKCNQVEVINQFNLLTAKPVVYLVNLSEKDFIRQKNKHLKAINTWVTEKCAGSIIPFSAEFEMKLSDCKDDESRLELIKELGAQKSMLDKIVKSGYSSLHLLHFYTCGEDEVRCWTLREGSKAPQAGGVIHTDFERGFICADVYKFSDLVALGGESQVKAGGKLLQKGKDYVVEENDVIHFKFNVTASKK
eukprot:GHVR01110761.1.p1 GENE.GHVR01110761.1~~GHVR01110761.1.p1  ORF type:complete len:215 (+),score=35.37 GHVR01110761.1:163-807(+)